MRNGGTSLVAPRSCLNYSGRKRRSAAFSYIPSSSQAYETLQFITNVAPFRTFSRGLHYYGASAMVLMIGAHHGADLFVWGLQISAREMTWTTGFVSWPSPSEWVFTFSCFGGTQPLHGRSWSRRKQAVDAADFGNWLAQLSSVHQHWRPPRLVASSAIHVSFSLDNVCLYRLHLWLVMRHGISEPPVCGQTGRSCDLPRWNTKSY